MDGPNSRRIERTECRTNCRNGYRGRALETQLKTLHLPKLRQGSLPGLPGDAPDLRDCPVIQQAWIGGVSTHRVDEQLLNRQLSGDCPDVWLDACYLKVRRGGRTDGFICMDGERRGGP